MTPLVVLALLLAAPTPRTFVGHTEAIVALAFSPDGRRLATGAMGGALNVWVAAEAREEKSLELGNDVLDVAFSSDGKLLAAAVLRDGVHVFETDTWKELKRLEGRSVELTAQGKQLVVGLEDAVIQIYAVATWRAFRALKTPHAPFVAASPDGKLVASRNGGDKDIHLWDVGRLASAGKLTGHGKGVTSLSFASKGTVLASASEDRTVRLWDVAAKKELKSFATERVPFVALSPDGKRIAVADGPYLKLWEVEPES